MAGHDVSMPVLHIAVARPTVAVAMLPACGCDGCDSGSQHLLEAVDQALRRYGGWRADGDLTAITGLADGRRSTGHRLPWLH